MNRILLITHYFGPLPNHMQLWLNTCAWNPDVDFVLLTDQDTSSLAVPANVRPVASSIEELSGQCAKATGMRFVDHGGYKIVDWRPVFGAALPSLVDGFAFWGHCDSDVFWGRIRDFITDDILDESDIISADNRMMCGPFTLYRNSLSINSLWCKIHNYQGMLDDPKAYGVEESHMHGVALNLGNRYYHQKLHASPEFCKEVRCSSQGIVAGVSPVMFYHFRTWKPLQIEVGNASTEWTCKNGVVS